MRKYLSRAVQQPLVGRCSAIAVCCCISLTVVQAADYQMLGPRALSLSGAGMTLADGAAIQYLNPAQLGFHRPGVEEDATGIRRRFQGRRWAWAVDASAAALVDQRHQSWYEEAAQFDSAPLHYEALVDGNIGMAVRRDRIAVGLRVFHQSGGALLTPDIPLRDALRAIDRWAVLTSPGVPSNVEQELLALRESIASYRGGLTLLEVPVSYGHQLNEYLSVGGTLRLIEGRVHPFALYNLPNERYALEAFERGVSQVDYFVGQSNNYVREISRHYTATYQLGVDLGVQALYQGFSLTVLGRNLNSPRFRGTDNFEFALVGRLSRLSLADFDPNTDSIISLFLPQRSLVGAFPVRAPTPSVTLDPQATVALSWGPEEDWFHVEVMADVVPFMSIDQMFRRQYLAVGLEFGPEALKLRCGYRTNIASGGGEQFSLGLGINFWGLRWDMAAALGRDRVRYDTYRVPAQAQASMGFALDF